MTVGLDLGATEFRSLRRQSQDLISRCCPAMYTVVPDSAPHRRLLTQSQTPFITTPQHLVVVGEMVAEWAKVFQTPPRPLLPHGELPKEDPLSRQLLSILLDSVLPPAKEPGEVCGLIAPGGHQVQGHRGTRTGEFFAHLVSLKGYQPVLLSAAQAVSLAELSNEGFCGLAVSLGATTSDFVMVHSSEVIGQALIPRGWDDFFDKRESELFEEGTGSNPSPKQMETVQAFLKELFLEARLLLEKRRSFSLFTRPLTLVMEGRMTSPALEPLLKEVFHMTEWPMTLKRIRWTKGGSFSVARGGLIEAELTQQQSVAA